MGTSVERPPTLGWASAATAVHAIRSMPSPVVLHVELDEHEPLHIDVAGNAYAWTTPLELLPPEPHAVAVRTEPRDAAQPLDDAQDLDTLLWPIGLTAFGEARAPWLRDGDRYQLVRWPNFTRLRCTPEQIRMTAGLGNGWVTLAELAGLAGVGLAEAERVATAFSLMGLIRAENGDLVPPPPGLRAVPAPAPVATPGTAPAGGTGAHVASPASAASASAPRDSLFSRLRRRLGL